MCHVPWIVRWQESSDVLVRIYQAWTFSLSITTIFECFALHVFKQPLTLRKIYLCVTTCGLAYEILSQFPKENIMSCSLLPKKFYSRRFSHLFFYTQLISVKQRQGHTVSINFVDHVLQFCFCWILSQWSHDRSQLFRCDGSISVFVKQWEGLFEFWRENKLLFILFFCISSGNNLLCVFSLVVYNTILLVYLQIIIQVGHG